MAVSTTGVGSGIDIKALVEDMISAEGKAKSIKLSTDEATVLSKITAFGSLKGVLSDFQSKIASLKEPSKFQGRIALSGDETKYLASASSTASQGSYSIEVTQLAKNHKLSSENFALPESIVGTGTLKFTTGTVEHSFSITSADQTLRGVVNRVNETSTTTGISATLVTSDLGSKIVFSSNDEGADNIFTVSVVSDSDGNNVDNTGLSKLDSSHLTVSQTGLDSKVIIDGSLITSSSNTVSDAIDGVELTLKDTNIGDPKTLNVNLDKNVTLVNIQSFVSSYNTMMDTINNLKKASVNGSKAGDLVGDSALRNIEIQIRREISNTVSTVPGGISTLAELGITSDRYTGKLIINNTKLTSVMDSQFDNIGKLFAKEDVGVAVKLDSLFEKYLDQDGVIKTKTDGLSSTVSTIKVRRAQLDLHLQKLEERLLAQFSSMDRIVASLRSTSDFLTQQLNGLSSNK